MAQQTAKQAVQAIDERKANKVQRSEVVATGKTVSGSIMLDSVKAGMRLPNQMALVVNAYYDLVDEAGGNHQMIKIDDITNHLETKFNVYAQDAATIIKHYKLQIEGSKEWKHQQGKIKIGSFQ